MDKFKQHLEKLADHEDKKSKPYLSDPRARILVDAGIRLNWLGDFLANLKLSGKNENCQLKKFNAQHGINGKALSKALAFPKFLSEILLIPIHYRNHIMKLHFIVRTKR